MVLTWPLLSPSLLRADPTAMSAAEYKLWVDYKNALEDPRVKRMKPRRRLPRIARNFGVKLGQLKRAIAKGEKFGATIVAENQEAAEKALKASKVGAKVSSVELVETEGLVISYVSWNADDKDRLAFDATYIARAVADAAPLTDTIALWACMGKKKVWTGMIRLSAAQRINASRIEDFALTRYLRLFEDVHNRFEGKPPMRPKRDPKTGKPLKDPKTGKPVLEPDDEC
jgi:hypothetical protein